jgi:hypothetical protein
VIDVSENLDIFIFISKVARPHAYTSSVEHTDFLSAIVAAIEW